MRFRVIRVVLLMGVAIFKILQLRVIVGSGMLLDLLMCFHYWRCYNCCAMMLVGCIVLKLVATPKNKYEVMRNQSWMIRAPWTIRLPNYFISS
jgi:hypothetical protein